MSDKGPYIKFGTDDLLQPDSLFELSRKRHADKWTMDPDLNTPAWISKPVYNKVGTISKVFGVSSSIILNSAVDTGSYYVHHYQKYCGDNLKYANIFRIMERINEIAPLYEVDVEEGTNAHRPFFGALDTAMDDYKRYVSTHLVQSKERKQVRIEMNDNLKMLLGGTRWVGLTYRDGIDAIVMSGLTIDSVLDRQSWDMYKEFIPKGYIGVPGAFIRSLAVISEIILKLNE